MTTYTVRAKRWEHGWELHIDGIGVTQSRTLDTAEGMVRDYVASLTGRDTAADAVEIRPDLGGLEADAAAARERVERSQREGREAIAAFGKVAQRLRGAGLSLTDTATLLGVSRGRISQLGGTGRLSSSLRLPALSQDVSSDAAVVIHAIPYYRRPSPAAMSPSATSSLPELISDTASWASDMVDDAIYTLSGSGPAPGRPLDTPSPIRRSRT